MDNYLKSYYSETEKPYTDYPKKLTRYLIERFNLDKNKTILDVGYGRGEYLKTFEEAGYIVFGIDGKDGLNFENEHFTKYSDNYVDIVFCKSIIEHIANYDNFMTELYRILKPNGKIIILTPDWSSIYKIYWDDYSHKHPYTFVSIKHLLIAYNFKIIHCSKFIQLPFLWHLKYFSLKDLHPKKLWKFLNQKMLLAIGEK
jgi:ubiquinone/menaquinone biosynthesis C-methylase UbiE